MARSYLIDLKHAVIVDVEATTTIRQAEVGAAKTILDRTAEQFDLTPSRLVADEGYGWAALSQAQAEATREAQRAGIEHAKARDDAYRGRKPSFTRQQLDQVRDMLTTGTSISTIAKTTGLSRQAIYRLKDDPAWAEGVLETWAA